LSENTYLTVGFIALPGSNGLLPTEVRALTFFLVEVDDELVEIVADLTTVETGAGSEMGSSHDARMEAAAEIVR
jgi:hypothetical protein